jgi:hypothetical protein
MKLDGLAKGKIKATEQMAPSSVEVGEAYRDGSGMATRATINFDKQPSVKYPGLMRVAYMQEKVDSKAELNQWPFTETPAAFNVAMKLILSLARNESFIVSSERFERVVGFANGGYADSSIGEGSVEIQCEKMRSVEMANGVSQTSSN